MFRITFAESPGFAADFAATDPMLADFGEVTLVPYGELYPGPYEVTPGDGAQTLRTQGLVAARDIVVNPIPENYGKITWNGSVLTVS